MLGHYVRPCYGADAWSPRRGALHGANDGGSIVEQLRYGGAGREAALAEAREFKEFVPELEPPTSFVILLIEEGRKLLSDDRFWYLAAGFALAQWRQE